jgi:CBS domain-containing protein
MTLKDILGAKGDTVYTISPDAPLEEVARTLVEHNVGSLVVCRRGDSGRDRLAGIITERDLLHCCALSETSWKETKVSEVMTTEVITGSPSDAVEEVMGLMTKRRIRHLPILSEGRLVGMVSIGDVVKAQHDRLAMENRFMKDYIRG